MLCTTCHKYENKSVMQACHFCRSTGFEEQILCELTRGAQRKRKNIECQAFRQRLSLVAGKKKVSKTETDNASGPPLTEKQKYNLAKALQQLQRNPDETVCNLMYHVCLVTTKREPVFANAEPYIEHLIKSLAGLETKLPGIIRAELLWLASDHLHIFIETTPDYSVDELVRGIRKNFDNVATSGFPALRQSGKSVWGKLYFSETIG